MSEHTHTLGAKALSQRQSLGKGQEKAHRNEATCLK